MRVSREDQCLDRQIDALTSICDEMRFEKRSAISKIRPVFDQLINELQSGDSLIVWDIDRAFRSSLDAISCSESLLERGIGFQILTMNLDTSTRQGRLIYAIMAAIAQHEREHLIERTKEGLEAARARGKRLGRPPKMSQSQLIRAKAMLEANETDLMELSRKNDMHPDSIRRAIRRLESD
ncbi:MAG: recombinase family protein [Cohaesibacter sp.]|nr:recombinase family protein [Cohaesibacter sp.]